MSRQLGTRGRLWTRWVWALCVVLPAAGCGTKSNIKGTVSYQGKNLDGGQVAFHTADGKVYSSGIAGDGSYEIVNCPTGEVKITVVTPRNTSNFDPSMIKPPQGIPMPENKRDTKWPTILVPEQFNELDKTDLKYTVTSGDQTHAIEIK